MLAFFTLAAVSPGRQQTFRYAVALQLLLLFAAAWLLKAPVFGQVVLVAGIVEGAILVGWRLTQLPRSQALEFLLVSPLPPQRVFLAEALVGLSRLALVTFSGLPLLAMLTVAGYLDHLTLLLLLVMPFTWGALTGLGLTVWAYESRPVRRWGERCMLVLIVVYLAVGVLAGERLRDWLGGLPPAWQGRLLTLVMSLHQDNPFGLLDSWLRRDPWVSWEWTVELEMAAVLVTALLLLRGAWRMRYHFQERHYQPAVTRSRKPRSAIGDRPLSWWAVKRVSEYAGRINVWLAGGVGLLYAVYTLAGPHWPSCLGRQVFELFDRAGGIPVLSAGLVVLAAVPAAFQYGLWDSSAQDRCRRLELLLLTDLDGRAYWDAAGAAAWARARAYFGVAGLLWVAGAVSGQMPWAQALLAAATAVLLWGFYFALGFRAFARGLQANGLGMGLTLGLPLLAWALYRSGGATLGALLPPGAVYVAGVRPPTWLLLPGPLLAAGLTLLLARHALAHCDRDLRRWYEQHHGRKVMD